MHDSTTNLVDRDPDAANAAGNFTPPGKRFSRAILTDPWTLLAIASFLLWLFHSYAPRFYAADFGRLLRKFL